MRNFLYLLSFIFLFQSCIGDDNLTNPAANRTVLGMKPIYGELEIESIRSVAPQPIGELGNFVVYGDYLLVIENFKGVHVLDNADPSNPTAIAFWEIITASQLTINNSTLFVDFGSALVSIDISDVHNIKVLDVVSNFSNFSLDRFSPEDYFGSFECYDPTKGTLIGWEEVEIFDPKCWR